MFTNLVTALSQFFVHPMMFAVGSALVASPIIIHLINRMRFRKVRFAAMEFLLQAQQRNRRRLLLEQLLLLLLRILIVLAIAALLARLILDPRLTVFGGEGKAHHLVLLDDSASMRNRWGDTTAFKEAKEIIRTLVREGAKRPQTQKFSMVLLSKPNDYFIAEKDVDDELVRNLEETLETLEPSYQRPNLQAGLEIAGQHLQKDRAVIKHLHVLSDYRQVDWQGKEPLGEILSHLHEDGISVNLIRTADQHLPNLGITTLDGDVHAAAVGVPVRLKIGVTNFGEQVVENVRATLVVDGEKLPLSVSFPKIEAGQEDVQIQDLTFNTEGPHQVRVELDEDSLSADNDRYLSVDIPLKNNVLIVSSDIGDLATDALKFALAPDPDLTGISPVIVQPDFLRRESLARFRSIYMVNVPEIPLDALPQLEAYVRGGGGLVWFLGENIKVDSYNALSQLEENEEGELIRLEESLFPVKIGESHIAMDSDPTLDAPDLNFVSHPIFNKAFSKDSPLIAGVNVTGYMPVAANWVKNDSARKDDVTTVGFTRDGAPVVFDHRFGKGRVMTFLTSAGSPWNNLEKTPVHLLLVQETQKYVAKPDEEKRSREIGEPIELELPALDYEPEMEWLLPGSQGSRPHTMERRERDPEEDEEETAAEETDEETDADEDGADAGEAEEEATEEDESAGERPTNTAYLYGRYIDTTTAGIYGYKVRPMVEGLPDKGEFAYNVAPEEGNMKIASNEEIREHLASDARIAIRELGDTSYLEDGIDPGQEVRNYLMYLLLFLFVAEQAMAYRLSYHPETAEAAA